MALQVGDQVPDPFLTTGESGQEGDGKQPQANSRSASELGLETRTPGSGLRLVTKPGCWENWEALVSMGAKI